MAEDSAEQAGPNGFNKVLRAYTDRDGDSQTVDRVGAMARVASEFAAQKAQQVSEGDASGLVPRPPDGPGSMLETQNTLALLAALKQRVPPRMQEPQRP